MCKYTHKSAAQAIMMALTLVDMFGVPNILDGVHMTSDL